MFVSLKYMWIDAVMRYRYDKPVVAFSKGSIYDEVSDTVYEFTMDTVLDLLNEQNKTIERMGWKINSLEYLLKEAKK